MQNNILPSNSLPASHDENQMPEVKSGGFVDPGAIADQFGLKEGMNAADFGAGSGYFTVLLAKLVGESGHIYAIDVLENALDAIRSRARQEGLRNIETIRSNLEVLGSSGIPAESQDAVLLANILFQSDRKAEIMQEAQRVLKSEGTLIVVEWKNDIAGLGPPLEKRLDQSAMRQLITEHGFLFIRAINAGDYHYGLLFKKN